MTYLALSLVTQHGAELGLGERLPLLLPLSAYAEALAGGDVPLDAFFARHYRERGVDLPFDALVRAALEKGRALLLLDGLDEVKVLARRNTVVERVRDFYSHHRRAGNKFVLTSRIVGYREVRFAAKGLAECTIVDFDDDEIEAFVDKWTVRSSALLSAPGK